MKPLLRSLLPILDRYTTRKYGPSSIVLYQGEVPRTAYLLVEGVVKVYGISDQGEEQIISYHVPGEFFPTSWIFGKSSSTIFFYETMVKSNIALIPRIDLVKHMVDSQQNNLALLDYFTTSYSSNMIRTHALSQSKAEKKLIFTMFYLCERYGVKHNNVIRIPIKLTHQNIAAMIGLTRETTSSEMSALKKKGVIRYSNQLYTINYKKLLDMIGEDALRGLKIGM